MTWYEDRVPSIDRMLPRVGDSRLDPKRFELHLKAPGHRMPPQGGFGVERFAQSMLELPNNQEAVMFPRDRNRLVP